MNVLITTSNGNLFIDDDGNEYGIELTRNDRIICATITHGDGANNVHIYVDEYNIILKYKYMTYAPLSGYVSLGDNNLMNLRKHRTETNKMEYIMSIAEELMNHQSVQGQHLPYRVAKMIQSLVY